MNKIKKVKEIYNDNIKLINVIKQFYNSVSYYNKSDYFKKLLKEINNERLNIQIEKLLHLIAYHKKKNKISGIVIMKIKKICLEYDNELSEDILDLIDKKEDLVSDELDWWHKNKSKLENYYVKVKKGE